MAPTKFMDLSVDIKTLIVGYVIRPTDLKSLCLTSKQLHEITVRHLYKEISLDVGQASDMNLVSMLNRNNIGLQHIRKLDVSLAEMMMVRGELPVCHVHQLQQANLAIRMIIELLPEDILEKFSWRPWEAFSADNLLLLYKKQKRMKWLEAFALDKNILAELEKLPDSTYEHVHKLGLYPDSREVLNFCSFLIERARKIERLTLHPNFRTHGNPGDDRVFSPRELNDSSTGPGLITSTIFSHMQPFKKCKPLALSDLTLHTLGLRYAADTYCHIIDWSTVKTLRVLGCTGADAFFAELSRSSRLPDKLETLDFKHDDNPENDGLIAVDGFLCLVSGIKALTLDINCSNALPASAGIVRQAKTLRELNVHAASTVDAKEKVFIYDLSSFQAICQSCKELEQLSLDFPNTCVIRSKSDLFAAFEVALGDLPNLVTLNITSWPTTAPSSSLPRKIYEQLLQGIAQDGFTQSAEYAESQGRSSKLSIVAFGVNDQPYDRVDSKNIIIFVKGKKVDSYGKETPCAIQVGYCLRKFIEPRSDVLDFGLGNSRLPPVTEATESDDSD